MSITNLVSARVKRMRKGTPFHLQGFYDLGSPAAVQKALSRLVENGTITRLSKGVYSRPKEIRFSSVPFLGSAELVAKLWAKEHGHKLANQAMEDAYRLGMQTQAPMKKIFWTTGSSREFSVGNEVVQVVKRSSHQQLLFSNSPEGAIYRGLITLNSTDVTENTFLMALKRLSLPKEQAIRVVGKLSRQSLPEKIKQALLKTKEVLSIHDNI